MRAVGLKVLKNNLSEYVRLAAGGETVLVNDGDRVVAELGPPGAGRASEIGDSALAELVRRGLLTPAPLAGTGAPPSGPPVAGVSTADLVAELGADRDERGADRDER